MNKLIRGIGCFVLTCIIFACPVCLTLLFALGNAKVGHGFFTAILALLTLGEFSAVAVWLFFEYDTDGV